ncbi:atrial natriuretic peptide receptor 1 [Aplochiton taeniatus]
MTLSGSQSAIEALRDTQQCLLSAAVPALRSSVRVLFSGLSMRICLLAMACLIYPVVLVSFKQMTEWIQNYARSLREKTEDLRRQRQLAEDLLHQMLPKSVAKQLRQQKHVEAESYENVTIFFSDIVGFTSISASCNPLQVVEMLNNLYMCFDTRIDSYDVYKVETIGDAYMVVSGLPERNGDKHADEIAKMSLDLVAAVRQVLVPHMPNKRLQLRAGIHTGPCVAGIVGYKMPRYCLFGDTVNTASRMESTSLPQKIHASSATYLALMKDNAYELQLRGEIDVKGKGKMNTYWLVGHKNYSVQNDSLVCHWRPGLAKKKKTLIGSEDSMGNSCVTVQSYRTENTTTPVSLLEGSPGGASAPVPPRSEGPGLSVSAQVERGGAVGFGTLGSRLGGLEGEEQAPHPAEKITYRGTGDKPDLLPGSLPHL